jgi:hypothetical protein
MPKVRALAPLSDKEGNPIAAESVVDVDDATAAEWRAAGKASLLEDEERSAKAALSGNYNSVTGRLETGGLGSGGQSPGPQSDDEPPKRGKR